MKYEMRTIIRPCEAPGYGMALLKKSTENSSFIDTSIKQTWDLGQNPKPGSPVQSTKYALSYAPARGRATAVW
eukprot:SAG31_NODE_25379_length_462_cov_1.107438_1_plen_73_part_00